MKEKKTEEQLKKERREKANKIANDLKLQLITISKKKDGVFAKLVECREKGLKEQEQMARNQLRQYLATEKRYQGMLMSMELAMDAADLNDLNIRFLNSMNELSQSVITPKQGKVNMKKTKQNYMKALYNQEKTKEATDQMLELGDYASAASIGSETYNEYDSEIDAMLDNQSYVGPQGNRNRI